MFVGRNKDGSIYGLWTVRPAPEQEELPDDHPEVAAFVASQTALISAAMKRPSLDDVIAALPPEMKTAIQQRVTARDAKP